MQSAAEFPALAVMPTIGVYMGVLVLAVKAIKVLYQINFDQDQQVLRDKIKRLFIEEEAELKSIKENGEEVKKNSKQDKSSSKSK